MINGRKTLVYVPPKSSKPSTPAVLRAEVETKARDFIESELKPFHIRPPSDNQQFSYIVDIGTKWYRSYFYLFATPGSGSNCTPT
jgi:hypothetical protein